MSMRMRPAGLVRGRRCRLVRARNDDYQHTGLRGATGRQSSSRQLHGHRNTGRHDDEPARCPILAMPFNYMICKLNSHDCMPLPGPRVVASHGCGKEPAVGREHAAAGGRSWPAMPIRAGPAGVVAVLARVLRTTGVAVSVSAVGVSIELFYSLKHLPDRSGTPACLQGARWRIADYRCFTRWPGCSALPRPRKACT